MPADRCGPDFEKGRRQLPSQVLDACEPPVLLYPLHMPWQPAHMCASCRDTCKPQAHVEHAAITTQSWLVSLFLDCPPGLGYHCPSPVMKEVSRLAAVEGSRHATGIVPFPSTLYQLQSGTGSPAAPRNSVVSGVRY